MVLTRCSAVAMVFSRVLRGTVGRPQTHICARVLFRRDSAENVGLQQQIHLERELWSVCLLRSVKCVLEAAGFGAEFPERIPLQCVVPGLSSY